MRVTAKGNAAQIAAQRSLIDALIAHGFSRASIAIRWLFSFYSNESSAQRTMEASYNLGRKQRATIEWIAEGGRVWWSLSISRQGRCPAEGELEFSGHCGSADAAVVLLLAYAKRTG